MIRQQIIIKVLTIVFTFALAACGNSGSTNISGTAAAGAAIIGQVTVKDALDNIKSVSIEANGNYNIDVSGMTPPFRLRAEGTVGGRTYRLHSYAEQADIGGTINITPFTELIIANTAKQIAASYFDSVTPDPLNPVQLDEQEAALKIQLQGVFTALGVDATVSLLYDSFSADHTGLDAVLDAVRVESNTETNTYTIQNYLDNSSTAVNINEGTWQATNLGCTTESGLDGNGAPVTPYSFNEYEIVVKSCITPLDLSMIDLAGSVFVSGSETITYDVTGNAATANDPGTGTIQDSSDNSTTAFQWYTEQADCYGCTHSYIVLYTDTGIDPGLPANYWYRQTAALIDITGMLYSYVSYSESNYSDTDRLSGSDGAIWNETQTLQ